MKREISQKRHKLFKYIVLILGIIFTLLISAVIGIPVLKFAGDPETLRNWVENRGILGRIAYIFMVFIQVVIAVIPGEPLEIAGGYAFGAIEGTILCLFASTLGSLTVFALVKRFGRHIAELFFSKEKLDSLKFLRHSQKRDFIILFIFTLPGTPKDLISYFVGMTDMNYTVWLLICSFGRIPSVITSTLGGDALGSKRYVFAAVVFGVTVLISVLGIVLYNNYCNKYKNKQ